ncbi:MAG TPA: alpha/beta hydrolase [Candidatus Ventrimonas merdavium]|mgnify:CR=1 FL=1|nr:alpha/beta hydrolase [Candidatus Ventrimonas merdavium]
MRYETRTLAVPGQQTGPAKLNIYLLDPLSVAPDRRRPMVIVVPGGGYEMRSDREKEPVAMKFLAMGCHACVLDYSVAPNRFPVALEELALTIATIRENADAWHVKPDAIIPCGFSAGGHLACSIGTFWNRPEAYEAIGKTPEQVRPDGLILCYPVITAGEYRHAGSFCSLLGEDAGEEERKKVSLELQVSADMPPVFLWHTVTDDSVPVENSLLLAGALRRHGINFEMHLYPSGCHGLSLATEETAGSKDWTVEPCCQSWISLVQSWIEEKYTE